MLTIKCARCRTKLMKYKKVGSGRVIRCWEDKIMRLYKNSEIEEKNFCCRSCNNIIGEIQCSNNGRKYVKMNQDEFIYSGTKINN